MRTLRATTLAAVVGWCVVAGAQQLPPEAVMLDKVKIAERITTEHFDPVTLQRANPDLPTWTHDGVTYGSSDAGSADAFAAAPDTYAADAEKERWILNFMVQMSPIWCPVTDEIGPGNMLTWEKEGLLWESCCTFCDQTVQDEMFPRAVKRLRNRAEQAFAGQGAHYVADASSPVEGAIDFDMEPSDRAGEPIMDTAETEPAWLAGADLKATYTEGIGLILEHRCLECHRPGSVSPVALESMQDFRRNTAKMKEVLEKGTMPPWPADPAVGAFANSKRLTEREVALLKEWVDNRFPMGEGTYERSERWLTPEWNIGEPDLIIDVPAYEIPEDVAEEIHSIAITPEIDGPKTVVAAEILPTDRFLVHAVTGGALGSYFPGASYVMFEDGRGMTLKSGEAVAVRFHYIKDEGYAELDDFTRIALRFGDAETAIIQEPMRNESFTIPPGAENHEVVTEYRFEKDATLFAVRPFMLGRGKDVAMTVVSPTGEATPILSIPKWDPKWAFRYALAEPIDAPKGTVVRMVAHFDNSEMNPNNFDPEAEVTAGANGEVLEGWLEYTLK